MPMNTTQLIGQCNKHRKVCTDRARLHAALARLGKTKLVEDEEVSLLYGFDISKNTTARVKKILAAQRHRQHNNLMVES